VWEPYYDALEALEDDERAASAFLSLGGLGLLTWIASAVLTPSLVPATSVAALVAVTVGLVGWRSAKQELPREASTLVAVVVALTLGLLWLVFVGSLVLRVA
jgi:hypothetical protein